MGRTFVEDHGDVRAEDALNGHGFLGAEEERGAVEVRAKFDPVRADFADFGKAEDLEAATVGEDRRRPIHKAMKAAGSLDDFQAGTDVEMVGVAEDDLGAHLAQFAGVEGFDAGLGADRHEDGGVDDAAGRRQPAEAGAGGGVGF